MGSQQVRYEIHTKIRARARTLRDHNVHQSINQSIGILTCG